MRSTEIKYSYTQMPFKEMPKKGERIVNCSFRLTYDFDTFEEKIVYSQEKVIIKKY